MDQSGFADLLNQSTYTSDQSIIYNLILPNLDPNSVPYIDASNTVVDIILNNGQIVIGSNGAPPVGANITGSNDVIVTNGPGSITLTTPQPIGPTASPTFDGLTANHIYTIGLTATNILTVGLTATNIYTTNFNATNISVIGLTATNIYTTGLTSTNIYTTGLTATNILTTGLTATNILTTGLTATNIFTTGLTATNILTTGLTATNIYTTGLTATNILTTGLTATNIYTSGLTASNIFTSGLTATNILTTTINGKVANDLVTGPASAIADNLASYNSTTGKIIKDSGISTTSVSGGPFLKLDGTATMLGNIKTGGFEINGVAAIRPTATNIIYGSGSAVSALRGIAIGNTSSITGGLSNDTVVVGDSSICSASLGTVIGASAHVDSAGGIAIGYNAGVTDVGTIVIGALSTSTALLGHVLGVQQTNTTANSLLVDCLANIRSSANTCSLGTTAEPFSNIYLAGSVSGSSNTRTANNIVSNGGAGASGNLASFLSDKVIQDSGVVAANVVTGPASSATNNIAVFSNTTGKVITTLTSGIGSIGAITLANTTDSSSVTTGTLICPGGIGCAKAIFAGGAIKTTDATDSSSTTTGSIVCSGGIGCTKQIRSAGKITVSTSASAQGLDLATADSYANLRVIQNTTGADKHLYLGFNSGTPSDTYLYSNGTQIVRVESGSNVGIRGSSYGSGVGVIFIANRTTAPSTNPSGGGVLYCEGGALRYMGSSGTITVLGPA